MKHFKINIVDKFTGKFTMDKRYLGLIEEMAREGEMF